MRSHSFISIFVFATLSLCGCSASSSDAPATSDSGTTTDSIVGDSAPGDTSVATDSAPVDSPTAETGDLCSKLPTNAAAEITDSVDSTAFPGASATGGVVESGTYEQIGHVYYQPTSTPTHKWQGTMAIDMTAGTSIANISRDGAVFQQTGSTFVTSGNELTIGFTCPAAIAGTTVKLTYTYAAGKLTIFTAADKTATIFQKK